MSEKKTKSESSNSNTALATRKGQMVLAPADIDALRERGGQIIDRPDDPHNTLVYVPMGTSGAVQVPYEDVHKAVLGAFKATCRAALKERTGH